MQHMPMYNHGAMVISLTITKNIPSIIFSVILLIFSNAKQLYKHICSVVHEIQQNKYNCALWQRKITSVHICDRVCPFVILWQLIT